MSFLELVEAVSKHSGLPKTKVARVLQSFAHVTIAKVKAGLRVKIPGFGVFVHKDVDEKVLFGGTRKSTMRRKVHFRQSRKLR